MLFSYLFHEIGSRVILLFRGISAKLIFFSLFFCSVRTEGFDFFSFHRVISGTWPSSPSFTDLYRVPPNSLQVSYPVSVSTRLGSSWLQIGRVVLDSADFLNPGIHIGKQGK